MAHGFSLIEDITIVHCHERPFVLSRPQSQPHNTKGTADFCLAMGMRVEIGAKHCATGPGDELPDAMRRIELAFFVKWRETLVIVIMTAERDIRYRIVEDTPKISQLVVVTVPAIGKSRVMKKGKDTLGTMRGQVRLEPDLLSLA